MTERPSLVQFISTSFFSFFSPNRPVATREFDFRHDSLLQPGQPGCFYSIFYTLIIFSVILWRITQ